MAKRIVIIPAILLVLGLFLTISTDKQRLHNYLISEGFDISSEGFKIKSREEEDVAGVSLQRITAVDGDQLLEIKIMGGPGQELAYNYIRDQRGEIESLFTEKPAPYAAMPRRNGSCPDDLRPQVVTEQIRGENYTYYKMKSKRKGEISICSRQARYYLKMLTVYCSDKEVLVEIQHFYPVQSNTDGSIVESFRCD